MYHHCKQQAYFDQKRVWQIDRFTVIGHGMAPHIVVKWHRLDSPLYCVIFGHFLTPVMQLQEHLRYINVMCLDMHGLCFVLVRN